MAYIIILQLPMMFLFIGKTDLAIGCEDKT